MATATATASRNTRRARRPATRTRAGRTPARRWSIPTARWSRAPRRSASCRAMSTTPGCAWRRSTTRSGKPTEGRAPARQGRRAVRAGSTRPSGTRSWASTPSASTATRSRCWSVASNPGHCLWSGIVPPERAARVVERLMAPDMWSGWGIRTLSADHAAYNPALLSERLGVAARQRLHRRWVSAATASPRRRCASPATSAARRATSCTTACRNSMPGSQRDADHLSGAVSGRQRAAGVGRGFLFSLSADAARACSRTPPPASSTSIPRCPTWMPDLALTDLRLGARAFDLRLWREGETTRWEVTRGPRDCIEARSCVLGPSLNLPVGAAAARPLPREDISPRQKG